MVNKLITKFQCDNLISIYHIKNHLVCALIRSLLSNSREIFARTFTLCYGRQIYVHMHTHTHKIEVESRTLLLHQKIQSNNN